MTEPTPEESIIIGGALVGWVFQGNPKLFDVEDYVARYPELIYWRTPRYESRISVGDRAFIWRSGPNAGAIAIGQVVEAPTPGYKVKHPEAIAHDLWRSEEPDPDEPLTGIHLEEVRLTASEGFLPRDTVKSNDALAETALIKMPNGTVFPLDQHQTESLERMWGMATNSLPFIEYHAKEGGTKLVSHYRRERSSALQKKKLEEAQELYGKIFCNLCGIKEGSSYPSYLGRKIFEVHHLAPLAESATPARTTLEDLVVLCANCHKAVHATTAVEENYETLASYFRRELNK